MPTSKPRTIAAYIDDALPAARQHLRALYAILKEIAPEAKEDIKWGHPVLEEKRILFSFSAHKSHVTFMPTGPALEPFRDRLADFKLGKDTIQFPYDRPLPEALIREIAAYRVRDVRENDARWMY
jgi:uncharacterized protein YdhG (YjbR/CyaY superfamily)